MVVQTLCDRDLLCPYYRDSTVYSKHWSLDYNWPAWDPFYAEPKIGSVGRWENKHFIYCITTMGTTFQQSESTPSFFRLQLLAPRSNLGFKSVFQHLQTWLTNWPMADLNTTRRIWRFKKPYNIGLTAVMQTNIHVTMKSKTAEGVCWAKPDQRPTM